MLDAHTMRGSMSVSKELNTLIWAIKGTIKTSGPLRDLIHACEDYLEQVERSELRKQISKIYTTDQEGQDRWESYFESDQYKPLQ